MSVIAPKFRLGYLVKGITDNIFWIIVLLTLIGIPIVQIVLIYIDFPVIDGEIWNPFRVFDAMTHPERALPLVANFMQTDLFKVVAFPGFGFAALIAAAVIFVERKMLAKLQLRVGPFYCGKVEGILQLMGDGLKLISKEIIIPAKADKPLFWAAPVLFAATAAAIKAANPNPGNATTLKRSVCMKFFTSGNALSGCVMESNTLNGFQISPSITGKSM